MASTAPTAEERAPANNRRLHPRHRIEQLAYVACGSDNGGILIDISEGGLGFQGVAALEPGQLYALRLMLPKATHPLEVSGETVWRNSSGKGGGLRFVNLPDGVRRQVTEWIAAASQPDGNSSSGIPSASYGTGVPTAAAPSRSIIAWETSPAFGGGAREIPEDPASGADVAEGKPQTEKTPFLDSLRMSGGAANPPAESLTTPSLAPAAPVLEAPRQPEPPQPRPLQGEASIHRPTLVTRSASLVPAPLAGRRAEAAAETGERGVLSTPHRQGSGTLKFVLSAALGCAVVLAAIFGMRADHSVSEAAGRPTSSQAAQPPAGTPPPAFQVQVLNGAAQPWTLTVEPDNSAPAESAVPASSSPANQVPPQTTQPPIARTTNSPAPVIPARPIPPMWDLRSARPVSSRMRSKLLPAELHAPAIAESALRAGVSPDLRGMSAGAAEPAPPGPPVSRLQQAVLINHVAPVYPPMALEEHVQGVVRVNITVGKDGIPKALRLLSGDRRLAGAAVEAIHRWRYRPAMLNGKPVETQTNVHVDFHLRP